MTHSVLRSGVLCLTYPARLMASYMRREWR